MKVSSWLDAYQRRHSWAGLPLAVIYKFVDDQGSYLAALITYYAFVSLFPLFLVVASVLGFVLHGDPHLQEQVLGSSLTQFPIVGTQIADNLHQYTGSRTAVVIGIAGSVYGGLGVAQAAQNAMNIVWAVPRHARPNPIISRVRSLALLSTLGLGVIVTTGLSAISANSRAYGVHLDGVGRIGAVVLAVALNCVLFVGAYRFLTVKRVSLRNVLLGAVVAGLAWQGLQTLGTYYIAHRLKGAQEVYGVFGVVLGLVAWLYIESIIIVICAELNVVLYRRLWPRALLTPFTDRVNLTEADKGAYDSYAGAQKFKGFETIDVDFPKHGEFGKDGDFRTDRDVSEDGAAAHPPEAAPNAREAHPEA